MRQAKLYIGSEKLDLQVGEVVAVTLTANNYEETDKVNSSFTNTFKLPWTRQNLKAIGALMANEATGTQYAINDSLLKYDPIDVFGSLYIFESNPQEAEAAFVSGIAQFFDDLGDATLWCLFNSHTFANTRAGYIGELTNTYTDGFTTALASFSTLPTDGTDININRLYPFPFYWQLFNDIATFAGWTVLDTDLLADIVFRKTALAYNGEQYNEQLYFSYFGASWGFSAGTAPGNYLTATPTVAKPLVYNERFGNIAPFISPTDFRYDSTADCGGRIYELRIGSIDITTDAGSYDFDIRIGAFSGNTFVFSLATYSSGLVTGAGATLTLPVLTLLTDWNTAEFTIHAQMKVNVGLLVEWQDFTFRFCDGRDNNRDLIWGAVDVMPYCSLPSLKMTEFIKGVCKQFGAIPKVDGLAKTISFVKFQTLAQDFAGAADWSGKIDSIEKIEWRYGEYGKINNAVYDNDEEMPETYARGQLLVNSANLPEVYEWLKLPFSASLQVAFADDLINFAYIPVYDVDNNKQKLNPRCVHILFEDVATVGIVDNSGTTNVTQYNLAVFARNQDDYTLSFAGDKGLLAFYHYSFGVMIGRMYKLTATFALSANDFAGLNFFAPVFISQRVGQTDINGWFILQEVKEWDGRKTVECELLKIEFE